MNDVDRQPQDAKQALVFGKQLASVRVYQTPDTIYVQAPELDPITHELVMHALLDRYSAFKPPPQDPILIKAGDFTIEPVYFF